jgi:hypothetical protein
MVRATGRAESLYNLTMIQRNLSFNLFVNLSKKVSMKEKEVSSEYEDEERSIGEEGFSDSGEESLAVSENVSFNSSNTSLVVSRLINSRALILSKSMFARVSETTIASSLSKFPTETQFVSESRLPQFKVTSFTPQVVKDVLHDLGFQLVRNTKQNRRWVGYWGRHYSPKRFEKIKPWQIVNHYPAAFELGRKDCLWQNYSKKLEQFGSEEFNFIPDSFILPVHHRRLRESFSSSKQWIVKPTNGARVILSSYIVREME